VFPLVPIKVACHLTIYWICRAVCRVLTAREKWKNITTLTQVIWIEQKWSITHATAMLFYHSANHRYHAI